MSPARPRTLWPILLLSIAALAILYAGPIGTPFLNDDYQFLEGARNTPLIQSLGRLGALGNFYRPLSRQVYFELLTPIAGGHPLVFHLVGFALFLAALALLADLLVALLPPAGAMAGCLYFALLPLQRVNLTWVSCSQDLLALVGTLGALALFRRGRFAGALLAYLGALASKEAALPLPVALAAWELVIQRRPWRPTLRRVAPFAALGLAWAALALAMRVDTHAVPALRFDPGTFAAGYVHQIQSLLGLEHPPGMLRSLLASPPAIVPLALLAALALWVAPRAVEGDARPTRDRVWFAALWLVAFGIVTGPVAVIWSAYYYTLSAVGGAVLVGLLFRRGDRWAWIGLVAALTWWHAGSSNIRAFAVRADPWVWTSHLTSFYFERAARLAQELSRQLRALEPDPPAETRFYFARLTNWAGFQMGNGALIRTLYRDPSLESYFYSQFSESTAADRPVRFIDWDGERLGPLYPGARDPFFQVGSDLLLLDRPAGAAHAFLRGLREGGDRMDLLYWLGWAELWRGNRSNAEAVWTNFGATDDTLRRRLHIEAARRTLFVDRDTLETRRHLITAIEYGIGYPEAHAVLGHLLMRSRLKYGLLELKVASWLDPRDVASRRELFVGLVASRLDDAARAEMAELETRYPEWGADSIVVRSRRTLEKRATSTRAVIEFP